MIGAVAPIVVGTVCRRLRLRASLAGRSRRSARPQQAAVPAKRRAPGRPDRIILGARTRLCGRRCWHGRLGRALRCRRFVARRARGGRGFPRWRRFAGWRAEDRFSTLAQARAHRRPAPAVVGSFIGLRWRAPRRTRLPEHQTSGRRSSSPMLPAMVIISAEACRTVKGHDGRDADLGRDPGPAIRGAAENSARNKRNGEGFRLPRSTAELTRSLALDFGALGCPL